MVFPDGQRGLSPGWLDEAMQNYNLAVQMEPGNLEEPSGPGDDAAGRAGLPPLRQRSGSGRHGLLYHHAVHELPVRRL